MQQIGVHIRDDKGQTIEESAINFADVMEVVYEDTDYKNKYPLLATVDPYDDTIFNSLQVAELVRELNMLPPRVAAIKDSIALLSKLGQSQYVGFFGD